MIRAVKGTRDILPPGSGHWASVEAIVMRVFKRYNYREIRTPIFEETQLFARSVGSETDIVSKEMYSFDDRDGTSLTLRPENTASVMRAYAEHRLDQNPGTQKLYYMGPMFRRERPQKGRFRQFHQIGAEAIGSERPEIDAEVIVMVADLLKEVGVSEFTIIVNSVGCAECRPQFLSKLREALLLVQSSLCSDCQRRAETNPLRVLDCKVPQDQPIIDGLPSILDSLCEKCSVHFETVKTFVADRGLVFTVNPRLVRGLDYYSRTTFEFTHDALGAQNSILGGGRYDGLAEQLGSRVPSPGIGFSIGQDRLMMILGGEAEASSVSAIDVFVSPVGGEAVRFCAGLAHELRQSGVCVEVGHDNKLRRSLELAHKLGARYTLIVGEQEMQSGQFLLKEMVTGVQKFVSRPMLLGHIATTNEHGI